MPKFSIVLVALGLLFSHTAIAQDAENSQEVIIPLFSQKLSFNLPDGWRATDQDVTKGIAYVEFGKNDYSDSDNKDRLRVYIFKNLARTKSLEEILGGIVSTDNEHCADNLQITTRYMDSFSNREATYTTHFCSQKVRPTIINEQEYASETSYVSAMRGKKSAVTLGWVKTVRLSSPGTPQQKPSRLKKAGKYT